MDINFKNNNSNDNLLFRMKNFVSWIFMLPIRMTFLYASLQCILIFSCSNSTLIKTTIMSFYVVFFLTCSYWVDFSKWKKNVFVLLREKNATTTCDENEWGFSIISKISNSAYLTFVNALSLKKNRRPWYPGFYPTYHPLFPKLCYQCCFPNDLENLERHKKRENAIQTTYKQNMDDVFGKYVTLMERNLVPIEGLDNNESMKNGNNYSISENKSIKTDRDGVNLQNMYRRYFRDGVENSFNINKSRVIAPRMRHCKVCNRCNPSFSHHCPFVGKCITEDNHLKYLNFILTSFIFMLILSIYLTINFISITREYNQVNEYQQHIDKQTLINFKWNIFKHCASYFCQLCVSSLFTAYLFVLTRDHVDLVLSNNTISENIKHRHLYGKRRVVNPYDYRQKYGFIHGSYMNLRWKIWRGPTASDFEKFLNINDHSSSDSVKDFNYIYIEKKISIMSCNDDEKMKPLSIEAVKLILQSCIEVIDALLCLLIPYYVSIIHRRYNSKDNVSDQSKKILFLYLKMMVFPDIEMWSNLSDQYKEDLDVAVNFPHLTPLGFLHCNDSNDKKVAS